jgi:hypothetical protein
MMQPAQTTAATKPLTRQEALRLIWQADCYPILGNEDWKASAILAEEALAKAEHAIAGPDDPPGYALMLAALRNPKLHADDRDDILVVLHSLFDPEDRWLPADMNVESSGEQNAAPRRVPGEI